MSEGVQLAWVLLDGVPQHVSVFAGIPPSDRPEVRCPACEQPVVLRLGERLAHHAAHRAGQECAVTAPESALHLNCKLHIAAQLRGLGESGLQVAQPCAQRRAGCAGRVPRPWLLGWDEVAVELRVAGRRPDIVLLREDVPLAAIEVCVSSPITPDRRDALAALGLSWVEVRGTPALQAWQRTTPLPITQSDPDPRIRCTPCAVRDRQVRLAPDDAGRWRHALRRYETQTIRARAFAQSAPAAASRDPSVPSLLLYDRYSPHQPRSQRGALLHIRHKGRALLWDTLAGRCVTQRITAGGVPLHTVAARYLSAAGRAWVLDPAASWWTPLEALGAPGLLAAWQASGAAHRWRDRLPDLPLPGPLAMPLDLVRYLLDTHLAALPRRMAWTGLGWAKTSHAPWRPWPTRSARAVRGAAASGA